MKKNKDELIEEIAKDVRYIKLDLAEMKVDVRHHIKRSDAHEEMLLNLSRVKERLLGAVALIGFFATLLGIFKVLN